MKRPKLMLKLSLGMIVLGIIIYCAGVLMGGKASNLNNNFISIGSDDTERIVQNKELNEFSNISIDVSLDYVELIKSNENKIELNYSENLNEVKYEIRDNDLIISQLKNNNHGIHFNINGFNNKNLNYMKLYVKDTSTLKNIDINTYDSDIKIDSLNNDNINIQCNYGNVDIKNLTSNKVDVVMDDGNLKIDTLNTSALLNIKNNYGNVSISESNLNDFVATLKDGSLNISNSSAKNSDIKNNYGDITSTQFLSNEITIHSNDGNIDLEGTFLENTTLNNEYGNINVSSSENENSYNYFITNNYGNINIGNNKFEGSFNKDNNAINTFNVNCKDGNVKLNFKN